MSRATFKSKNLDQIEAGILCAARRKSDGNISRYYIDFRHAGLNLHRVLSAPEISILQSKIDTLMQDWDDRYEKLQKHSQTRAGKELAESLSFEAAQKRDSLKSILLQTLAVNDAVQWGILKDNSHFIRKEFRREDFEGASFWWRLTTPETDDAKDLIFRSAIWKATLHHGQTSERFRPI